MKHTTEAFIAFINANRTAHPHFVVSAWDTEDAGEFGIHQGRAGQTAADALARFQYMATSRHCEHLALVVNGVVMATFHAE